MALRIFARGQKPVKADWNRLAPTKAVNKSQWELKSWDRIRLIRTKLPAKANTMRSIDISFASFSYKVALRLPAGRQA